MRKKARKVSMNRSDIIADHNLGVLTVKKISVSRRAPNYCKFFFSFGMVKSNLFKNSYLNASNPLPSKVSYP